jgi:hypothetical protein
LEKLSTDLKITYWTKDMVYPFSHKFVLWDDIKEYFTGFARIIEFKCMAKGIDGYPDPTIENADRHNWITSISEGQYKKGMANGYVRYVNAHNGHCKMGYHLNGQAHGKWVEHKAVAGHWQNKGIYKGDKLLKEKNFLNYLENEDPDTGNSYKTYTKQEIMQE